MNTETAWTCVEKQAVPLELLKSAELFKVKLLAIVEELVAEELLVKLDELLEGKGVSE
jgi:hypothetical protein